MFGSGNIVMYVSGVIGISKCAAFPADTDCSPAIIFAVIIVLSFGRSIFGSDW